MATDVQSVALGLLDDIDAFCQKTGCNYYLGYEAALSAYRSSCFESGMDTPVVLMPLADALAFFRRMEAAAPEGRAIECALNNCDYDSMSFSYCDTNSVNYPLNGTRGRSVLGIRVRILPLRQSVPSRLLRMRTSFYTKGWLYNQASYDVSRISGSTARRLVRCLTGKMMARDKERYVVKMFRRLEDGQSGIDLDAEMGYEKNDGKVTHFPKGIFSAYRHVELEGHSFRIPENVEGFFAAQYGATWRTKKFSAREIAESQYVDTSLPYPVFLERLKQSGVGLLSEDALRREKNATKELKRYDKVVGHAWHVVLRTGARFALWQEYRPLRNRILSLREEERWDELAEVLAHYDEVSREMYPHKLSVCFDVDILTCYLDLLRHNGEDQLASKIEKWVPEEHLKSIDERVLRWDAKGEEQYEG